MDTPYYDISDYPDDLLKEFNSIEQKLFIFPKYNGMLYKPKSDRDYEILNIVLRCGDDYGDFDINQWIFISNYDIMHDGKVWRHHDWYTLDYLKNKFNEFA